MYTATVRNPPERRQAHRVGRRLLRSRLLCCFRCDLFENVVICSKWTELRLSSTRAVRHSACNKIAAAFCLKSVRASRAAWITAAWYES
eukprot:COSAG01_NODE_1691_length_9480_cov_5.430231_8_plen_89_part_00